MLYKIIERDERQILYLIHCISYGADLQSKSLPLGTDIDFNFRDREIAFLFYHFSVRRNHESTLARIYID